MTGKQLEKIKRDLNTKYYGDKVRTPDNLNLPITDQDKKTFIELDCIEMINSCLVYGSNPYRKIKKWWYGHGECERSYLSDYEDKLGVQRVRELVDGQVEEFKNVVIHKNCYTDSEGCSYNSVEYWDD